jgi:hypothetical protein
MIGERYKLMVAPTMPTKTSKDYEPTDKVGSRRINGLFGSEI